MDRDRLVDQHLDAVGLLDEVPPRVGRLERVDPLVLERAAGLKTRNARCALFCGAHRSLVFLAEAKSWSVPTRIAFS